MRSYSRQLIENDDIEAVISALKQDILTGGATNERFENAICEYSGAKFAVTFNNATSALLAAYYVVDLKKNDEFITTPISFAATANAGLFLGARPVFCDVKPNGLIDEAQIEAKITQKTKAIVPVHYSGALANMQEIARIAAKHRLAVIEDAAHAFGSKSRANEVGSLSDMAIFSFHPVKPITTLEGGAIITNNEDLWQRLKLFRSHGIKKGELWGQDMLRLGLNFRLNDVSAALGLNQLKKLERFINARQDLALFYDEALSEIDELEPVILPSSLRSSRHIYPVIIQGGRLLAKKRDFFARLRAAGLGVQVHYKPINQMGFYKNIGYKPLEGADDFYARELSIPCHQALSRQDARTVINTLKECIRATSRD
ncbi:MAG: UDP-4-amino-4,6-dideoxy-N-acetyl-beta-L-altrosamine transaminase [Helicobacteraceae bacterium]